MEKNVTGTDAWRGFRGTEWKTDINVRDFVQKNIHPYDGGEEFLEGPSESTEFLWGKLQELQKEERRRGGVLSAAKYAKVRIIRNAEGLAVGFSPEGSFPRYGNDDDRADSLAVWVLKMFTEKVRKQHTYRNSEPTMSVLTITSNVVYGRNTGATPDGRPAFTPFAPGANPSYGAEQNGLLASLNSVAKLPYLYALDGISDTQTVNPGALGHTDGERADSLSSVLSGYFAAGGHHLNVNVFGPEKLKDAMEHPEKEEYANFTVRVSGYAVKFIDLTREQQLDVTARTCHTSV